MWPCRRRIVLVGRTGNGKSSTGNLILRKDAFEVKRSLKSITKICTMQEVYIEEVKRYYEVVDTPGLFDTDLPFVSYATEIHRSLEKCPKPHAFLLVFSTRNRLSPEEKHTIDALKIIFGDTFCQHAIIVFTAGNDLDDADFENVLKEDDTLTQLIKDCSQRIVKVDSKGKNGTCIDALLKKVEEVSRSGKNTYKDKYQDTRQTVFKQAMEKYKDRFDVNIGPQVACISVMFKERLEQEKKEYRERTAKILTVLSPLVLLLVRQGSTGAALQNVAAKATGDALKNVVAKASGAALQNVADEATQGDLTGILSQNSQYSADYNARLKLIVDTLPELYRNPVNNAFGLVMTLLPLIRTLKSPGAE